jgi:prolyl 4-hydroxylase
MQYTSYEQIPKLTETGFKVIKCPDDVWNLIQKTYKSLKSTESDEQFQGKDVYIKGSGISHIIQMPLNVRNEIHQGLLELHKDFCKVDIEPSYVYGIRSYKRGATLTEHKDRVETHHIASIIVVDKDLRCGCRNKEFGDDWPLDIQDHKGNWHKIYAEPGDMIIYESAACSHARFEPFQGTYYNNLFVHYKFL